MAETEIHISITKMNKILFSRGCYGAEQDLDKLAVATICDSGNYWKGIL